MGQLETPPWSVLFTGMGAAASAIIRVGVPIDGGPSIAPAGLSGRAAQRHVNAGCSLMKRETTE